MRQEAFRRRLLHSLFGSEEGEGDVPGPAWPYDSRNDSRDWGAIIAKQEQLAEELVEELAEDGSPTGRMKWRDS